MCLSCYEAPGGPAETEIENEYGEIYNQCQPCADDIMYGDQAREQDERDAKRSWKGE